VPAHEIALRESLRFVGGALAPGSRVLEVGCGSGHLAAELDAAGHRVVALDASAERVAEAQARGVDARVALFPDFRDAPFDAVLFTHSLHHLHDLSGGVARARELLRQGGALVVEDFVWDELDARSVAWAYAAFDAQRERLRLGPDRFRLAGEPVAAWRKTFVEQHLHGAAALREALARAFVCERESFVPYFFRFACMTLGDAPDGAALAEAFLRDEAERIARGEIQPLGWQQLLRPRA
jgi:SAM-dependent methyltransferase